MVCGRLDFICICPLLPSDTLYESFLNKKFYAVKYFMNHLLIAKNNNLNSLIYVLCAEEHNMMSSSYADLIKRAIDPPDELAYSESST